MPGFNFPNLKSKASSKAAFVFSAILVVFIGFIAYAGDNLEINSADSKGCDITKTTAAQGCCKCDTGSMCLAENGNYRTCAAGCYSEKACPVGDGKNNGLCSQLAQCPGVANACAAPGAILNPAKNPKIIGSDGASYLQVCGTDYSVAKIQCGFTLKQKKAIACFEATDDLSDVQGKFSFTIGYGSVDTGKVNDLDEKIFTSVLGIRDSNGFTKCDDILNQQSRQAAAESIRTSSLGCAAGKQSGGSATCQDLELACCLTNDHCKSYGCDENIVYDWYYGCTKIDFGKAGFVNAKSDDVESGEVCAPRTFGCGEGISDAGYYKTCQPSVSNIHYWSENKKCDPNPNPVVGNCAQQDYCAHFGCHGALPTPQTWDNIVGNGKCQAVLAQKPSASKCPVTKCFNEGNGGRIKVWDGKSKSPDCKYIDSSTEQYYWCKECHDDPQTNKAVCDLTGGGDQKGQFACDSGAEVCGNSCYNKKINQICEKGTIFCLVSAQFADAYKEGSNYFPANYVCNDSHTVVLALVPQIVSQGRDGKCGYETYHVCHVDEKCAKGRCVKNADYQDGNKELGIPALYDTKTGAGLAGSVNTKPGKLIDRDSGNILDSNSAKCGVKYPLLVAIVGDARGCDNLNAALALIGSYNVKDKTWNEEYDSQGHNLTGPLTGTYDCKNFSDDTIKMLRDNGFQEAYTVTLSGLDANGAGNAHEVVAIKTGDIQYADGTVIPTFALIEPQSGSVAGQLGAGDNSAVVDLINYRSEPIRIDDAVVVGNYEYEDGFVHYQPLSEGGAKIYTYTKVGPSLSDEKCIVTSYSYKLCPVSVQ